MAKPKVFLSSTFYDLKQVRTDIDFFIDSVGFECVRNEEGDIAYGKDEALEEYCYKEIKNVDIVVSIIGGRYGSESKRGPSSVSQIELRTALKENKQVYVFIERNVLAEYETYLVNKDNDIKFKHVDNPKVYHFIEEIKGLGNNNNIKGFETASEITRYLKDQFAGLFQRLLMEQSRSKENSMIVSLEKTAQTLNKLVSFLSAENKDNGEEINRILMINHPLVEQIRNILAIPYNFYVEGFSDLKALLSARSFKCVVGPEHLWDADDNIDNFYVFERVIGNDISKVSINDKVFDEESRLKFCKKSEWDEDDIYYEEFTVSSGDDDDDLPF